MRRAGARGPRWWPAFVIPIVAGAFLAWNWSAADPGFRQLQVVRSVVAVLLAAVALLLWWLFFSRLALLPRLAGVALLGLAGFAFHSFYELRGFSGDLVPRVVRRDGGELPPLPPASAPAASEPLVAAEAPVREIAAAPAEAAAPAADPAAEPAPDPAAAGPAAPAPAFPQFLGPRRDARLPGVHLARDWSASPPREQWRQPIGRGWAGFAVAEGLAVTQEQRAGAEAVVAYDLETGNPVWSHLREVGFESALAGDGPRATPSIADGVVYALGATGLLAALDLATGGVRYERDVLAEAGARRPQHGVSASPLVLGELVVVLAGGPDGASLVGYDRTTGERRWSGGSDPAAYSSPLLASLAGVRQIVVFTQRQVVGHDAANGAVLWSHPFPAGSERVSQPVVLDGDRLFVSTGYGIGGLMLHVTRDAQGGLSVEQLYQTRRLKAKFTQVVEHQGFLYGLDDGVLTCIDPEDGERRWKGGRYGHGQVLLVGELLLVQGEDGEVVLIDPGPERLRELGRFQAVSARAWSTPALAGDRLLIRGETEVACFRIALAEPAASESAAP